MLHMIKKQMLHVAHDKETNVTCCTW